MLFMVIFTNKLDALCFLNLTDPFDSLLKWKVHLFTHKNT